MGHEQEKEVQQHETHFEPEGRHKLFHPVSSEDILVAVGKQSHKELTESKQHRLVSVKICVIGILEPHPYPITQNEADLEHDNIKDDKVDVLKPASQFFFMHNTNPRL
jgi:hypothetical protein